MCIGIAAGKSFVDMSGHPGIRAGAMRLMVVCILVATSSVEPMVLVAPALVSGAPVAPAPGLRAVWNDLTPLVSSAMQRFAPDHAPGSLLIMPLERSRSSSPLFSTSL